MTSTCVHAAFYDARPAVRPNRETRSVRTAKLIADLDRATDRKRRQALMGSVVEVNMGVARAIASRYRFRGIPEEDLHQVAYLALVRSIEMFDPRRGNDFLTYAVPTVRGEIRRHFRDQGWTVRPPRRIQELQHRVSACQDELSLVLGRPPRVPEMANHLGETSAAVDEALACHGCFRPASLDVPLSADGNDAALGDQLGVEDAARYRVEARLMLGPHVRRLGERDRHIVMLRFFRGLTQSEIAADIGVTQMQVSRLLARILATLRAELTRGLEVTR